MTTIHEHGEPIRWPEPLAPDIAREIEIVGLGLAGVFKRIRNLLACEIVTTTRAEVTPGLGALITLTFAEYLGTTLKHQHSLLEAPSATEPDGDMLASEFRLGMRDLERLGAQLSANLAIIASRLGDHPILLAMLRHCQSKWLTDLGAIAGAFSSIVRIYRTARTGGIIEQNAAAVSLTFGEAARKTIAALRSGILDSSTSLPSASRLRWAQAAVRRFDHLTQEGLPPDEAYSLAFEWAETKYGGDEQREGLPF